jgi:hypothetical protein
MIKHWLVMSSIILEKKFWKECDAYMSSNTIIYNVRLA